MYPGGEFPLRDCAFSGGYLLNKILSTSKHRRCDTTALVRNIPETFSVRSIPTACLLPPKDDACWYASLLILQAQQWVINVGYSCVSNNMGSFLHADFFSNP